MSPFFDFTAFRDDRILMLNGKFSNQDLNITVIKKTKSEKIGPKSNI